MKRGKAHEMEQAQLLGAMLSGGHKQWGDLEQKLLQAQSDMQRQLEQMAVADKGHHDSPRNLAKWKAVFEQGNGYEDPEESMTETAFTDTEADADADEDEEPSVHDKHHETEARPVTLSPPPLMQEPRSSVAKQPVPPMDKSSSEVLNAIATALASPKLSSNTTKVATPTEQPRAVNTEAREKAEREIRELRHLLELKTDELKERVQSFKRQLEEALSEKRSLEAKLKEVESENNDLKRDLLNNTKQLSRIQEQLSAAQQALLVANSEAADLRSIRQSTLSTLETVRSERDDYKSKYEGEKKDKDKLQETVQRLEKEKSSASSLETAATPLHQQMWTGPTAAGGPPVYPRWSMQYQMMDEEGMPVPVPMQYRKPPAEKEGRGCCSSGSGCNIM